MGRSKSEQPATPSSIATRVGTIRGVLGDTLCRCLDDSRSATASTTRGATMGSSDGASSEVQRQSISGKASYRRRTSRMPSSVASRTTPVASSAMSVPSPSAKQTRRPPPPRSMSRDESRAASSTVPGAALRQCSTSCRGNRARWRSRSTAAPPLAITSRALREGIEMPTFSSIHSVLSWMNALSRSLSYVDAGRSMNHPFLRRLLASSTPTCACRAQRTLQTPVAVLCVGIRLSQVMRCLRSSG